MISSATYRMAISHQELAERGVIMRLRACRQHAHRPKWPYILRYRTGEHCDMPGCTGPVIVEAIEDRP